MAAPAAQAQIRFEITGVGASQIPVAITAFPGEEAAPQQITSVVKADLARSGIFKLIDNGDALSDSSAINYADWQKRQPVAAPVIDYDRCTNCMQCLSFCLFGGLWFPLSIMPTWMSKVAEFTPSYHLGQLSQMLSGMQPMADVPRHLSVLGAISGAALAGAWAAWRAYHHPAPPSARARAIPAAA